MLNTALRKTRSKLLAWPAQLFQQSVRPPWSGAARCGSAAEAANAASAGMLLDGDPEAGATGNYLLADYPQVPPDPSHYDCFRKRQDAGKMTNFLRPRKRIIQPYFVNETKKKLLAWRRNTEFLQGYVLLGKVVMIILYVSLNWKCLSRLHILSLIPFWLLA